MPLRLVVLSAPLLSGNSAMCLVCGPCDTVPRLEQCVLDDQKLKAFNMGSMSVSERCSRRP